MYSASALVSSACPPGRPENRKDPGGGWVFKPARARRTPRDRLTAWLPETRAPLLSSRHLRARLEHAFDRDPRPARDDRACLVVTPRSACAFVAAVASASSSRSRDSTVLNLPRLAVALALPWRARCARRQSGLITPRRRSVSCRRATWGQFALRLEFASSPSSVPSRPSPRRPFLFERLASILAASCGRDSRFPGLGFDSIAAVWRIRPSGDLLSVEEACGDVRWLQRRRATSAASVMPRRAVILS